MNWGLAMRGDMLGYTILEKFCTSCEPLGCSCPSVNSSAFLVQLNGNQVVETSGRCEIAYTILLMDYPYFAHHPLLSIFRALLVILKYQLKSTVCPNLVHQTFRVVLSGLYDAKPCW